jgi:carboxypeptidase Taq
MEQEQTLEEEIKNVYCTQKEISIIGQTAALVDWDQKTYMPSEGIKDCSEKVSYLSKIAHEKMISKEFKDSIDYLLIPENLEKLNDKDKTVVKRLSKDVEKATKLPVEFVEELSRVAANAESVWGEAKKEKNFEKFRPHLERIVELKKEEAKLISLPGHPYNSLLNDFEEGMTVDKLQPTFEFLGKELTELLKKIVSTDIYKNQNEDLFKKRVFGQKSQEKLSHMLAKMMTLPEKQSRLDVSMHPFTTTIGNKDIRITTRYINNPLESFGSTIHEGGHALYELGLPEEYANTVICNAPSYGIHESQSKFWELIGKHESFWKHFYPKFKDTFKRQLKDVSFDEWYRINNIVKPSYIRIEADELTYCMHIILRYEIEKGLIEGNIQVKDLPQVWNDRFEQMFGIRPRHDSEGCLQDTHWSGGAIGYFPSYALGTIYSAQLYNQLVKENPGITKEIEDGKLENVVSWLRDKVHKYGRTLTTEEIITKACGEGLNPEAWVKFLHDKYSKIYRFEK